MVFAQRKLAAMLLVLGGVAGCSLPEEEFGVPERVCGVPLPEGTVRSVLPGGAELKESGEPLPKLYNHCDLVVDGESAVRIAFGASTEFYEPLKDHRYRDGDEITLSLPGSGAMKSNGRTKIILKCGLPGRPNIAGTFHYPPPGGVHADPSRADMKRFAVTYMAGAKKELGCPQPNTSPEP